MITHPDVVAAAPSPRYASDLLRELANRLPAGASIPKAGTTCHGSESALGTSNTIGSGKAASVVNVWVVRVKGTPGIRGYIVRTEDKRLWFEDTMGFYIHITNDVAVTFLGPDMRYDGCFRTDLPM